MAIHQGSYYRAIFRLQDQYGNPIPVGGWKFQAQFREFVEDEPPLLDLTSENGGFDIITAGAGRFAMEIMAAQSAALPEGMLLFDVFRTDLDPGPLRLFGGRVPVQASVTRT